MLIIMLMTTISMHAATLAVSLDGTQPYTSIQTAIDASTHGDIVLVYPGRYFENVQFFGKNITLASLELTTGDPGYKYLTIIDGNHQNSVIQIRNGESDVTIRGFSIVNGHGFYDAYYGTTHGGGLLVGALSGQRRLNLINCVVSDNYASSGGGMQIDQCYLTMSGVSIRNNVSSFGGGMFFAGSYTQYTSTYDPLNRCSIYSNYAAFGSDLYYYNVNSAHVIVDTFTVADPWNFYATAIPQNSTITNPFTFDILNTVHQEVNNDLYVAPWGDDANSGLSPAEPMKSVFNAMYRIASDSNDPKTVHVADGLYSRTLNGQHFPIPIKSHTRLIGDSMEGTIFNAESENYLIYVSAHTREWRVEKLSLINGKRGVSSLYSGNYCISNIDIKNIYDIHNATGISAYKDVGSVYIKNVSITNVSSIDIATAVSILQASGNVNLQSIDISNCVSTTWIPAIQISTLNECDILIDGCNIYGNYNYSPDVFNTIFQISPFDNYGTRLRIDMKSSAFYDNYQTMPAQMGNVRSLNDTLFISNCTFAGNTGGSATIAVQGTSVLTNNIFHNPAMNTQIWIPDHTSSGINSHTTLRYNNIMGGINGVSNSTPANPIIWGEGNTDYDPMFTYEGNRPYTLSPGSPLIDSGWQAALAEPGSDAGGNERLWDGDGDGIAVIDKGAYEYQPIWSPINLSAELWNSQVLLSWEIPDPPRGLSGYRIYRNHRPHADLDGADHTWFRERITVADTLVYQVAALYGNVESALSDSVVVIVSNVQSSDELAPMLPTLNVGPNPLTDLAVIRYTLPKAAKVELSIYNLRGQKVRSLESEHRSAGEHILAWEGCDDRAQALASGVYLLRLSLDGKATSHMKVVLVK